MISDEILIIDDEQSIINSIYRDIMFGDEEYKLYSANNGKDGLVLYYIHQPVLIVLDLNMPVMNGIEFLEKIQLKSTDKCSVIVMTGANDDENIKKCFELGVSAFLRKPFNNYEFIGLLKNAITLKRTQNELRDEIYERELAERILNKQREKFVSVLMEDMKKPLITVKDYTGIIAGGEMQSEEEKNAKLQMIQESTEDLLNTIENTSNALKDKAVLQVYEPEPVELVEIIPAVIKDHLSQIEDRGIEVLINKKRMEEWDAMDSHVLKADYNQMKILVKNLLSNAFKYAKKVIEIEINKSNSVIEMAVKDDGPGIKEIYHEKIFEEYFQIPGSKKGSGSGLFSAKKVVNNHAGSIEVKSSPDDGTSFRVALPCP